MKTNGNGASSLRSNRAPDVPESVSNIPAGDLPPQPLWPLIAASAAWGLWIVFLFAMMWMRVRTTSV